MQRSITSFFQPMSGDKEKRQEEPLKSSREKEPTSKAALKERNAVESDNESPMKRPVRKVARVLGSEGEEEDEEAAPATPGQQEPAILSPATSSASSSPSPSDSSPSSISPAGIPKRRTARKQIQKHKLPEDCKDSEPKRCKREGGENTQGRNPEQPTPIPETQPAAEASGKAPESQSTTEEAGRGPELQAPTRAPKAFSSFFTPRKPAAAKQAPKEAEAGKAVEETSRMSPDPASYNPSKSSYHPVDDACWSPGQRVPYLVVARTFEKIEEVSARLQMVETLSNLLRSVAALSPADLLPVL